MASLPIARDARRRFLPLLLIPLALIAVMAVGALVLYLRENTFEKMAYDVMVAIREDDSLDAVAGEFASGRTAQLSGDAFEKLHDRLESTGSYDGGVEITKPGAKPGFHEFTETFARGTIHVTLQLNTDRKIVDYHFGPLESG